MNTKSDSDTATARAPRTLASIVRGHLQPVLVVAIVALIIVLLINPAKFGLLVWGIAKLTAFAWAGDWVDQRIFPGDQPERLQGIAQGTAWKRKSLIVAAAIVAGAMVP